MNRLPIRPVSDAETAFAFVLGVLFNQRLRADTAWRAPWVLAGRIGATTPAAVLSLAFDEFARHFAAPPPVHPFTTVMAGHARTAAQAVTDQYAGDARQMWHGVTATQFLIRFQQLPGIGRHKALMALFVATRQLDIPIRADGHRYPIEGCASLAERFHPHREPLLTVRRTA